ncbi:MAG: hypothetical protein ACE5MB_00740 [Anaerolineae bacterium]
MPRENDLAYRVLRLEQQLESYQKLHAEELDEIRRTLAELKRQILSDEASAGGGFKGFREPLLEGREANKGGK